MTFEQVLERFQGYLNQDSCVQVVLTKWGYVRLFCEAPNLDEIDAVICRTPEVLQEELTDLFLAD